jgi:hypothetical protein
MAFPDSILEENLGYVMGLATMESIQLGPAHPSPSILQLTLSIFKIILRFLKSYFELYKLFADVSQ